MSKKATKKSSVIRPAKKSKPTKRIKQVSFKSSPWYALAAQSIGVSRALSGCQIEDDPFLQAGRAWAHAASVMSFQESKASLRAARYERAEIR